MRSSFDDGYVRHPAAGEAERENLRHGQSGWNEYLIIGGVAGLVIGKSRR